MELIRKGEEKYPKLLEGIKNAPQELYVNGDIECLKLPCITVVGSRNMSDYGKKMTRKIVKELTLAGMCIVSGLAVGIDSIAHQTCLENGGKTVAVIGAGLNNVYPPENVGLYNEILKHQGCVLSEYEPDTEAQKLFFPARNRIVSGLSLGTLVVEATYRSGTSITAKFAFDQGRKVFCVPNCIGNKNSCGTINLIKKGATLITSGDEILYHLGIIKELEDFEEMVEQQRINKVNILEQDSLSQLDEQAKTVYFYIKENGVANSEIISSKLNISIQDINMYLTILELKGLIINKHGNNYSLRDELYV